MIVLTSDGQIVNMNHICTVNICTHPRGHYLAAWEPNASGNAQRLTAYVSKEYADRLLQALWIHWRDGHAGLSYEHMKDGDTPPDFSEDA